MRTETSEALARLVGCFVAAIEDTGTQIPSDVVEHLTEREGRVKDVSLYVRKGEIVGLAGLVGGGKTELCKTLFGDYKKSSGTITLDGKELKFKNPSDAVKAGLSLVPEERRKEGVLVAETVTFNVSAACLGKYCHASFVDDRKTAKVAEEYVKSLSIKTPSVRQKVANLSGGNQQKVVVGNWLNNDPKIMIYDEPTRGIDVNAKQQIFEIMWNQAKQGNSSIFVSTELEELPGVCNRILVLRGGRITEELTTEKIDSMTTNDLYTLCMGGHSSEREN